MIWLTWRQFRTQAWVTAAVLAVLAIALAVSGASLARLYGTSGVAGCHANCATLASSFLQSLKNSPLYSGLYYTGVGVLAFAPAVIGVFWGAPLVTHEFETGTFRLVWNQSVSRTRWLAVKLSLLGLTAMATAGLLSLMVTWWTSPVEAADRLLSTHDTGNAGVIDRLQPLLFATRGITPAGYAALAFALGVTAGVLIRRTVPAMAATLATFAAVQAVMPLWVRPHLLTPVTTSTPLNPADINELTMSGGHATLFASVDTPGAWVLSNQTTSAAGRLFTGPLPSACKNASFQACQAAIGRLHLRQLVSYQPASRYWPLQWYESGIFLALTLVLAGFCFWWIRRRRLA